MDRVYRVEVTPLAGEMPGDHLLNDISTLGVQGVRRVDRTDLYFLCGELLEKDVALVCDELLADPIVQEARFCLASEAVDTPPHALRLEVGLLQGVTDSVADNLLARGRLLGMTGLRAASSAQSYLIHGDVAEEDAHAIARHLLHNDVIQYYQVGQLKPHVGVALPSTEARAERISIAAMSDGELIRLSSDRLLSLDLPEMRAVQRYYDHEGRDPTDVELECIAQTWSEHCVHKSFKGLVEYSETTSDGVSHEQIDSLINTYLQGATREIDAPWVRSAFVDNAGIIDFGGGWEVSFKVETHNHPSALEPFGGANTGIGGVVRDIIGVSARPIANTDILCFGPLGSKTDELPSGVLHPRRIYNGVVAGIEDYGNKMGIPTVNGAIVFEKGYTANPLVYCGCVGIAPVGSHPRRARPGDRVVVLGGRTGRDGLHGATFSSIELTDETGETSGGAVQIGNPITEKIMLDAILRARDERLYTAITDCGAGGLSSAVSEMGEEIGVTVQLAKVPLKYHGLQPWEIWLSEAQERMVLAVPPKNVVRLRRICEDHSVEMTLIGEFNDSARLRLYYGDEVVADTSMGFLHDGIPRRRLNAEWKRPSYPEPSEETEPDGRELAKVLLSILAHPNVRSKEDVVRRYDHEVQGGTFIKPFVGVANQGPSDATVIRPLGAQGAWRGIAIGCGFNPAYGTVDPYAMAICAIDEAVRNVTAVGADPDRIAILDNFCWGNPLLADRAGGLVRACKGCHDGAVHYGTPFISGKDSLNNEYADGVAGQQVAIPPTLLISSLGIVPDVRRACTMELKAPGNLLYLLGETRKELGGSYYYRLRGSVGMSVPGLASAGRATAQALHRAIAAGLVRACHDCSEGGLAVALAEMSLAGWMGASVSLDRLPLNGEDEPEDDWLLFSESNGRYVVEVAPECVARFEAIIDRIPHARVGCVVQEPRLTVESCRGGATLFSLTVSAITKAWRGHLAKESGDEECAR